MPDFEWSKELTNSAVRSLARPVWATANPEDVLRILSLIQERGGAPITTEEFRAHLGLKLDKKNNPPVALKMAEHLRLILRSESGKLWQVKKKPGRPGFYSAPQILASVGSQGVGGQETLRMLAHNWMLFIPSSLPLCCSLTGPTPQEELKDRFMNHYVFNQKVNPHKYDALEGPLVKLGILKITGKNPAVVELGSVPPALAFYKITEFYLFLARNQVGSHVSAASLANEIDRLFPDADFNYSVLGFDRFPLEGWGKHEAWMTHGQFARLLELGLVAPTRIGRVLKAIEKDTDNPTRGLARSGLRAMAEKFEEEMTKANYKDNTEGLDEVRSALQLEAGAQEALPGLEEEDVVATEKSKEGGKANGS